MEELFIKLLWGEVNRIAVETEDTAAIRALIEEAGIEPDVHVGKPPEAFEDKVTRGEWVLGQWASMIDSGSPFLNTARNASLSFYERTFGKDT